MTVIAVARKNDKIAMAADSLVSIGQTTIVGAQSKIGKVDDTLIGISGTCGRDNLLAATVFEFIKKCEKENRQWHLEWPSYCLSSPQHTVLDRLENKNDSYVLVVHDGKIFQVSAGGVIFECADDFLAIGCGKDYALGAMSVLWDKYKDPNIIATKAVEASCQLNAFCGLPVVCKTVKIKPNTRKVS